MASYNEKTSPSVTADGAATAVIILLAAVAAALIGVYLARGGGLTDGKDIASAESGIRVISGTETSAEPDTVPTEATVTEDTPSDTAVTEQTKNEGTENDIVTSAVLTDYSSEFCDRIFMVGDSLSVGFLNYEYLKPENVFAQVGLTPASVLTAEIGGETAYSKAAAADPDYICIMLGTNGLHYLSEDFMAEKMGEFIDGLRRACPRAMILLISIPPVTAEHEKEKPEKIENITKYNQCIAELAEKKSVPYVDTFSLLCDSTGYLAEDYAENDGLHFRADAYPVILSAVQTAAMNENYFLPDGETSSAVTEGTGIS